MTSSLTPNPEYDHTALVGQLGQEYDTLERLMKNLDAGIQRLGDPSQGYQEYATAHAHEFIENYSIALREASKRLAALQFHTQFGLRHE